MTKNRIGTAKAADGSEEKVYYMDMHLSENGKIKDDVKSEQVIPVALYDAITMPSRPHEKKKWLRGVKVFGR